jgi:hypothetical protein
VQLGDGRDEAKEVHTTLVLKRKYVKNKSSAKRKQHTAFRILKICPLTKKANYTK